ncbi:MAG: hypothetical protein ACRETQ_05600 [Gammaproteobacteria bacterium]
MYTALTLNHLDSLEQRSLWPGFGDLVRRARALLQDRTPDQIHYALDAVNFILDDPENNGVSSNAPLAPEDSPFLAVQLHRYAARYDIGEIPEFPRATWTELFAVLALGLLEEAAQTFRGWPTVPPPIWYPSSPIESDPMIQELIPPVDAYSFACFMAAVEALAFAHAQERIPIEVKKQISLRSQRGGIARHANTTAAKEAFWDYCQKRTFRSTSEAARKFCREHAEIVQGMSEENRIRTLTDYYRLRNRQLGLKHKKVPG